jgi:hypothetical protein
MSSDENSPRPIAPKVVPVEYAGQWVAWNREWTEIIARGAKMADVHQAAVAAGHPDAILQRISRPDTRYVGLGTPRVRRIRRN